MSILATISQANDKPMILTVSCGLVIISSFQTPKEQFFIYGRPM